MICFNSLRSFYPALYTPTSNVSISSPVENAPLIIDAHAVINSNSARAERSDPPRTASTGTKAIPTVGRSLPPRVMGRFDHPLPPMPLVCNNYQFVCIQDHWRSEEHTSELQSLRHLVCRLLLVKKK